MLSSDGQNIQESWTEEAALVIDTTASEAVLKKIELKRHTDNVKPISVISMVVGHQATRGLVTFARDDYSGGPIDSED